MAVTADKAYELMKGAHERGRLAHAYLITGPVGSGAEALAARVIEMVNPPEQGGGMDLWGEPEEEAVAKSLDELQGEFVNILRPRSKMRQIRIAEVRSLEHAMNMAAPRNKWKVGVVVDVDRMFEAPANAFLKTLEEPPPRCLLLLLTASPELLLPTIRSRCVAMALQATGRREVLDADEAAVFARVVDKAGAEPSAKNALLIKASFESFLRKRRAEIDARNSAALKEETATYKNATDGTWLEEREKFYQGLTESEYLAERTGLVDLLIGWFGDAVRQKAEVTGLAYPEFAKQTGVLAKGHEMDSLLTRQDALQELRESFGTNTQEALTLEVGFLKAFG